jgi:hypothetical protein
MRVSLLLNLVGTVLLFLSFQATSSNFRLITTADGNSALCVNQRALLVSYANGNWGMGIYTCPEWEHARPAAVVNIENPSFVTLGFICTTLGFLLQFLSVPSPQTTSQMRQEIKEAQKIENRNRKLNPSTGLRHSKK